MSVLTVGLEVLPCLARSSGLRVIQCVKAVSGNADLFAGSAVKSQRPWLLYSTAAQSATGEFVASLTWGGKA